MDCSFNSPNWLAWADNSSGICKVSTVIGLSLCVFGMVSDLGRFVKLPQDGIIDKNDTVFAELKVWQDKNSDAISQANKWIKIEFKKIKSLKLAA